MILSVNTDEPILHAIYFIVKIELSSSLRTIEVDTYDYTVFAVLINRVFIEVRGEGGEIEREREMCAQRIKCYKSYTVVIDKPYKLCINTPTN